MGRISNCFLLITCIIVTASPSCRPKVAVAPEPTPEPEPVVEESSLETVLIEDIPHIEQKPDFCGEACVAMWLSHLDSSIDQDEVFVRSGLDPELGRGVWTMELKTALEDIGFSPGKVWYQVADEDAVQRQFELLHEDLERAIPSIVCMYWIDSDVEHFRLVLGYDAEADEVIYHEPAETEGSYLRMKRETFLETWPLAASPDNVVIRLTLEHDEIIELDPPPDLTAALRVQEVITKAQ